MTESPDSPVAKADLQTVRADLQTVRADLQTVKTDLQTALTAAVDEIKSYVREQVFDAETKLLRAFADYNTATTIRFRKLEADVSNIDAAGTQRLALMEIQVERTGD